MKALKITVKKGKLIGFLKTNRQKHAEDYEEAVGAYFRKLKETLATFQAQAGANKFRKDNYHLTLVRPEDRTEDYDRIIGMLEMAEGEDIEIDTEQYDCIVNDQWDWARRAYLSNATYKGG